MIAASIAGCATTPHGYVLNVFSSSSQRCPAGQPRPSASRSTLAASTSSTPPAPSGSAGPPSPAAASRAASTPLAAAFPACSGLVIVPNASRCPAVIVAASDSARAVASASRPSSADAATAAPKTPQVPVMCQPWS